MDVASGDGTETEGQGDTGNKPSRAEPFAAHVCRNLADDVADIEDGQDGIVVEALEMKTLLETGNLGVS
jgi:hypothetical protein